jgi:hypothetical protein
MTTLRRLLATITGTKAAVKGKGPGKAEVPPEKVTEFAPNEGDALEGLNIFAGKGAPVIKSMEEYPEWIFSDVAKVYGPKKSSKELLAEIPDQDVSKATPEQLYEMKRAMKRECTRAIRRRNATTQKS